MKTPIVDLLNEVTPQLTAWCTPSLLLDAPRVQDIYGSDMSVSYELHGDPTKPSWDNAAGVFGEALRLAARAYHADQPGAPGYCLFSVNGSSGAIFLAVKGLRNQFGETLHILADRNLHKSLAVACEDYRVKLSTLSPRYHPEYQIFLPSSIETLVKTLRRSPSVNVVCLTNPTYEGFSLDLPRAIAALRAVKQDLVVFVDESWGSNFQFSPYQPATAMDSGADIAVVSTHKQGGALQQTAIILWKNARVERDAIYHAHRTLLTTSPSWHLLASIDAARAYLEAHGAGAVEREIEIAEYLGGALGDILPRVTTAEVRAAGSLDVRCLDRTKVLFQTHRAGLSGSRLAEELARNHRIIVERSSEDTILLVVPFQNSMDNARRSAETIRSSIETLGKRQGNATRRQLPVPMAVEPVKAAFEVGEAMPVPLDNEAIGRVCAEHISPYPPGIPLVMKGERILKEHIDYVRSLQITGKSIDMYCMYCENNILVEA